MPAPQVVGQDPGPTARFDALVKDESTMGVIVQRIAEGETLKQLADAWKIPAGRLAQWLIDDTNRNQLYINACALRETFRADEIHRLAEGVTDKLGLGIANLKLKATQWAAAKWNPARFGDTSRVAVSVKDDRYIDHDSRVLEAARTIAYMLERGAEVAGGMAPQRQLPAPAVETAVPASAPATDEGLI